MKILDKLKNLLPPKAPQEASSSAADSEMLLIQMISPAKLANKLKAAEQGNIYEQQAIFDIMEQLDGHLFAELSKRRRALLSLDWSLKPPEDATDQEIEKTKQTEKLIRDISSLEDSLFDLTDAISKGFSYLSIRWGLDNQQGNVIDKLVFVSQTNFVVDKNDKNALRLRNDLVPAGDELVEYSWVRHHHAAISGKLAVNALFRVLAWAFVFKHYNVRDLAAFLEVYGMPIRLGRYRGNPSKKDKLSLLRAVRDLGRSAFGIIPDIMDVEFVEGGKGNSKDYLDSINYWDRIISKVILGGTLTSQADGKSSTNALGNVHNDVRKELIEADAKQISETISRDIVMPLQMFNGLVINGRYARFEFDIVEEIDQKAMVDVFDKGVQIGMKIPVAWAHKKLQIPMASEEDEVLSLGQPVEVSSEALRFHSMAALKRHEGLDEINRFTDRLGDAVDLPLEQLVSEIKQVVLQVINAGGSYEEVLELLTEKMAEVPPQELVDVIAQAQTSAVLAGHYEVKREAQTDA